MLRTRLLVTAVLLSAGLAVTAFSLPSCTGVAVPDVKGLTAGQAAQALTQAGFTLGEVTYDESATGAAGAVVGQAPAAGDKAEAGSPVALTVAGPAPVPVPDLVGLTRAAAESAVATAGFTLGDVTERFHADIAAGRVVSQVPTAGAEAPKGSAVAVVLSKGPEPVAVPNVVGKLEAEARTVLEAAGFKVTATEKADPAAKGTVLTQSPAANAKAAPGTTVALTKSSGVVMVRVPDIRGLYGDAADKKLRAAGLVPKEVSIHGPIEPDAAEIGRAYRVSPAVGTLVPKGSTVSYHSWWESQ